MTDPEKQHSASATAPIGIFDSGVGGISILKEIQKQLPHEHLIYIADSANAPYGDKSVDFIQQRSLQLSTYLLTHKIKALVVACNTATTEAIAYLRDQLSIPIVGVEPAIKPAAEQSQNNIIGILATHRTIQSDRLQELISLYAHNCKVITQACPGLVEAVEDLHPLVANESIQLIRQYTKEMINNKVDTVVLGCTHYPFLRSKIRSVLGDEITILDTGRPVANQLERILRHNLISNNITHTENPGCVTFYSSLIDEQHHKTLCKLWGAPVRINALYEPRIRS